MVRCWAKFAALLLSVAAIQATAQSASGGQKTITILMLDSESGEPITTSELQIWTGESLASATTAGISPRYVKPDKTGLGETTMPPKATVFTVHAQYGPAGWGYVNCDRAKHHGTFPEHWYSIDEALLSGIAAPNLCSKQTVVVKPGQ